MNLTRLITYQEIAAHWQVSAISVRRWVGALERRGLITPLRPTRNTVRITVEDYRTLESHRSRLQCGPPAPSAVPLKSPQNRTRRAGPAKKSSGKKPSKSVLDDYHKGAKVTT